MTESKMPFGKPGSPPNWSPASKQGIGTARNDISKVWFTIANGIVTEVFYPTVDTANTKDLQFLITDGKTFVDEEKKDTVSKIEYIDQKSLAYKITNTAKNGRYRIEKHIVTDPFGQSLVIKASFQAVKGDPDDYQLFILLAPHVKNKGFENSGRCTSYGERDYLIAGREDISLALTADKPFKNMSCGYSGYSDGWQDIRDNLKMDWFFHKVEDGNIAMAAEVDAKDFTIALSFGRDDVEAIVEASKTLGRGYEAIEAEYTKGWRDYLSGLKDFTREGFDNGRLFYISAMVLKAHEDKTYKGGIIASMAVPWGEFKSEREVGGYHLVWPRDMVKAAFGFMAMGDVDTPLSIMEYLRRTQKPDGSWPQNMWLDGRPYWHGIQLDEVAFPILLAWRLNSMGMFKEIFYPMIKKAASYLVKQGPITGQERWEENSGFSPSTLAIEIVGLIAAAYLVKERGGFAESQYLFETADYYQTKIEDWTFTDCGCIFPEYPEHYQRIASIASETLDMGGTACQIFLPMKNLPKEVMTAPSQCTVVDGGFLELVRYGIRDPKDPHILKTLSVIDKLLKVDTSFGPAWHRYNNDGYGEKEDGSSFDGSGIGRAWPLLTGERGMYEFLANGNIDPYIKTMEGFANEGGMIPEQIWDTADIPEKWLFKGRGTGAATPLVWAHAEYIKLLTSKRECRGCDIVSEIYNRYTVKKVKSDIASWKKNKPIKRMMASNTLRIVTHAPAILHWSKDDWQTVNDDRLMPPGLDLFYIDMPAGTFKTGDTIVFTFFYPIEDAWEGQDYRIAVE